MEMESPTKDLKEISQLLLRQYNSVFSSPQAETVVHDPASFTEDKSHLMPHRYWSLRSGFWQDHQETKTAGPDSVLAILLFKCREALTQPLHKLWWCSPDAGSVTRLLKEEKICPIHKCGDRSLTKNYWLVALKSCLIKVFEKCARTKMMEYLEKHNFYSKSQHDFLKDKPILSKLP